MYYDPIYKNEAIYIAGPECFYTNGYPHWFAMASRAEMFGCSVTMPNNNELSLGNKDKRKDADVIFENCAASIRKSTAIIVDLEFYRGPDVDGGSIYEVGMAYALGCRTYGYTRDLRDMRFKYQGGVLKNQTVYDQKGRKLPYGNLPFSPNVLGSCKIVEGDFDDALKAMSLDITQERLLGRYPKALVPVENAAKAHEKPVILLAGPERWANNAAEEYASMKALCESYGLEVLTPTDDAEGVAPCESQDIYAKAYHAFQINKNHVQDCDIILANLYDFHGWEPDSDTSFECGLGYMLGKKLYGYMDNNSKMIERVPHFGKEQGFRDHCGYNVENFDYPINLMFSSSMPIYGGNFEKVLEEVIADLNKKGILK